MGTILSCMGDWCNADEAPLTYPDRVWITERPRRTPFDSDLSIEGLEKSPIACAHR